MTKGKKIVVGVGCVIIALLLFAIIVGVACGDDETGEETTTTTTTTTTAVEQTTMPSETVLTILKDNYKDCGTWEYDNNSDIYYFVPNSELTNALITAQTTKDPNLVAKWEGVVESMRQTSETVGINMVVVSDSWNGLMCQVSNGKVLSDFMR